MATVMRQWGSPLGTLPGDGYFVKDFDHEAHDGQGEIALTPDINEAKKFTDMAEAVAFYRMSPVCKPLRRDGRPNRPMTGASFEFLNIPD